MKLTIFTPTYNRKELLRRTYDSLCRQTCKDFEWVIVDDGSTDDTKSLVDTWISEEKLEINYIYTENGGKMRAHNRGVEAAKAPLFLCVDSDDYLVDTAVEDLITTFETYAGDLTHSMEDSYTEKSPQNSINKQIGGIVAHKGKSAAELLGQEEFPNLETSTLYGLYLKGFSGETTLMYKTSILREFPFPEIEGEKYVPEDYIYDKIDNVCELVVLPKIITVCEIVNEGYTDSVKRLKENNPMAWYLYYEQRAYITPASILKIKYLGRYVIYAGKSKKGLSDSKRIGIFYKALGILMAGFLRIIHKE